MNIKQLAFWFPILLSVIILSFDCQSNDYDDPTFVKQFRIHNYLISDIVDTLNKAELMKKKNEEGWMELIKSIMPRFRELDWASQKDYLPLLYATEEARAHYIMEDYDEALKILDVNVQDYLKELDEHYPDAKVSGEEIGAKVRFLHGRVYLSIAKKTDDKDIAKKSYLSAFNIFKVITEKYKDYIYIKEVNEMLLECKKRLDTEKPTSPPSSDKNEEKK